MDVARNLINISTLKVAIINYTHEKTYIKDMERMHAVQRLIANGEMEKRRNGEKTKTRSSCIQQKYNFTFLLDGLSSSFNVVFRLRPPLFTSSPSY